MPLPTKTKTPPEVLPMKEARRNLPGLSRCFAEKGVAADPVYFGAHRRPTGVMLSYERYQGILDLVDDLVAALEIRRRDESDSGERMTLEELIRDQGFDPRDFGLAD
jgi:antitoxin StbD